MKKLIKIYGERNTGTNYLSLLIALNLDVKQVPGLIPPWVMHLENMLPGREKVRDLYYKATYRFNLGWKHTRVKPVAELARYKISDRGIYFITITKNPYAWLLSLYRNPYHQYFGEKPDFETFVQTPWETVGRENCPKRLNNPVELWNVKNASYLPLAELEGINLTAESLLDHPESIIDTISSRFSIAKNGNTFINFTQSTKEKGKDINYYRDYYLDEKWRRLLSAEAVSTINKFLDRNLMDHFGYAVLPETDGIGG